MQELIDIIKMLPQGAAVSAVLIAIGLFLKHIKETHQEQRETIERLTDTFIQQTDKARTEFSAELKETRNGFSLQLENISDRFSQAIDGVKTELGKLTDRVKS